jgi:RNA polymerase sigma-70 factor (ECF subfamily)
VSFDDPAWLAQERQWLEALRGSDGRACDRAFDSLFDAYAQPLYRRILLPRLGDAAAAEDALSETFRKAFEGLARYEHRGAGLWPYLATIAINQAHDMHRAQGRRARLLASFQAFLAPVQAAPTEEPDVAALGVAVKDVLAAINPRYRRALELRFLEERPREQCAALLEVKLGTFDVLLLRALRAFRAKWQDNQGTTAHEATDAR